MKPLPKGLIGTWAQKAPWDSDDYLAQYTISLKAGKPAVSGVDLNDGEKFKVTGVTWDGTWLRFNTLMPSTGRTGLNEFRLRANGRLESRFTFTVVEEMVKRDAQQAVPADAPALRAGVPSPASRARRG